MFITMNTQIYSQGDILTFPRDIHISYLLNTCSSNIHRGKPVVVRERRGILKPIWLTCVLSINLPSFSCLYTLSVEWATKGSHRVLSLAFLTCLSVNNSYNFSTYGWGGSAVDFMTNLTVVMKLSNETCVTSIHCRGFRSVLHKLFFKQLHAYI